MRLKLAVLSVCFFVAGLQPAGAQEEVQIFLVRHAEKVDDGSSDPLLTEPGLERARLLAFMLKDAGITRIHSTDFNRTRDTASPLSDLLATEVSLYNPRDLRGFAAGLLETPGRHLVVGHSNTTPELVRALGGDPGTPIDEGGEYDRLYLVTVGVNGVETTLLRFGAPFGG